MRGRGSLTTQQRWLFVPRGCAVLYVPFRNQHYIKTTYPTSHGYAAPPDRAGTPDASYFTNLFVDVATLDNSTYCVVPHAVAFRQRACGGEAAIRAYCHALAREGGRRAAAVLGTEVLAAPAGSSTERCCLTNVRLPAAVDAADADAVRTWLIGRMFDEFRTYIPPFFYRGAMWVRFSAQVYLGVDDFEWGAEVLLKLCRRVDEGEWRR